MGWVSSSPSFRYLTTNDVYVYVGIAQRDCDRRRALAPTGATDVLANPGRGDIAVNATTLARRTPLEAENALRHAMSHVVAREASGGRIPRVR